MLMTLMFFKGLNFLRLFSFLFGTIENFFVCNCVHFNLILLSWQHKIYNYQNEALLKITKFSLRKFLLNSFCSYSTMGQFYYLKDILEIFQVSLKKNILCQRLLLIIVMCRVEDWYLDNKTWPNELSLCFKNLLLAKI